MKTFFKLLAVALLVMSCEKEVKKGDTLPNEPTNTKVDTIGVFVMGGSDERIVTFQTNGTLISDTNLLSGYTSGGMMVKIAMKKGDTIDFQTKFTQEYNNGQIVHSWIFMHFHKNNEIEPFFTYYEEVEEWNYTFIY